MGARKHRRRRGRGFLDYASRFAAPFISHIALPIAKAAVPGLSNILGGLAAFGVKKAFGGRPRYRRRYRRSRYRS